MIQMMVFNIRPVRLILLLLLDNAQLQNHHVCKMLHLSVCTHSNDRAKAFQILDSTGLALDSETRDISTATIFPGSSSGASNTLVCFSISVRAQAEGFNVMLIPTLS
ncbi:hypothetical protein EDD18DRAFT_1186142 [Armillaria luteobubalina]|uniref:Uncharacterized protein n=1 Tax=Armillaria luteobubalina TaxID=153913 RepID=A0AA39PWK0_9AGAR|nr:hypothetical protein EDD18DRAFT_1186142 [Armillaria luteobubalina]